MNKKWELKLTIWCIKMMISTTLGLYTKSIRTNIVTRARGQGTSKKTLVIDVPVIWQ